MAVGARSGAPVVRIELDPKTSASFRGTLKILQGEDYPELRAAMEDVGQHLAGQIRLRAPGSMQSKVTMLPVIAGPTKSGNVSLRARGIVGHPGAKSYEFGRKVWYRGFTVVNGRKVGKGQRFQSSPGQPARPFVGIVERGHAIGATRDYARERIAEFVQRVWNRRLGG